MWKFIEQFEKRYPGNVPGKALLANWFKVDVHTIYKKLAWLDADQKIKIIKNGKYNTQYSIIKK